MIIQYTNATSGIVIANDTRQNTLIIHDAEDTPDLSIVFPTNPFNGQLLGISTVNGIKSLSMQSTTGVITNPMNKFKEGENARYMYISSKSKWYKIQ